MAPDDPLAELLGVWAEVQQKATPIIQFFARDGAKISKESGWRKLADSAPLWGAIGLIAGAITAPPNPRFWFLLIAWIAIAIAVLQHLPTRLLFKLVLIGLLAGGFVVFNRYLPMPLSSEEQAILTAKELKKILPPATVIYEQVVAPPKAKTLQVADAFAVTIESRIFSAPGGDTTPFWAAAQGGANGCMLRSVQAALYIRLTNLQREKALITGYVVKMQGLPYSRVKMNLFAPFLVMHKGELSPTKENSAYFDFPSGNAFLMSRKIADAYPREARPIKADFLDPQLSGHYLSPGETVRGWSYFHYGDDGIQEPPMGKLTFEISDDSGRTFDYDVPESANENADTLLRTMSLGPTVDLGACSIDR